MGLTKEQLEKRRAELVNGLQGLQQQFAHTQNVLEQQENAMEQQKGAIGVIDLLLKDIAILGEKEVPGTPPGEPAQPPQAEPEAKEAA